MSTTSADPAGGGQRTVKSCSQMILGMTIHPAAVGGLGVTCWVAEVPSAVCTLPRRQDW